ncbi:MAG: DNA gyrase inhibitor YacG [Proteobacteria bacterium]|nr:DNA gyrase inhibitor YacG [Pseudomonadota bacterium]
MAKLNACPLCGKPGESAHQPFCSQGCKDRDLLNWLGDAYRMPGPSADQNPLDRQDEPPL